MGIVDLEYPQVASYISMRQLQGDDTRIVDMACAYAHEFHPEFSDDEALQYASGVHARWAKDPVWTYRRVNWVSGYQTDRCLMGLLQPSYCTNWYAIVHGTDPVYKVRREFLRNIYPMVWQRKPDMAFDFSSVKIGDLIMVKSGYSTVPGEALPGMPWIVSQPVSNWRGEVFVVDSARLCQDCLQSQRGKKALAHGFITQERG